jgi:predicted transcriptional regulator
MKKTKSANDWLTELMASTGCCGKVDEVPEGWMTLKQMADHAGVGTTTMNGRIQRWVKNGLLQKKSYKINIGRQICSILHYNKS